MARNFDRRVEVAFPIIDPRLQAKLKAIMEIQLGDTVKGWWIHPDGSSTRTRGDGVSPLRSQEHLHQLIESEDAEFAEPARTDHS
jgi:polyphosphate kinase